MTSTACSIASVEAVSVACLTIAFTVNLGDGDRRVAVRCARKKVKGSSMMDEAGRRPKSLGSMTTGQITTGIEQHQQQINLFLEQLTLRAALQAYTEQQQDELLTLLQKVEMYLEEVPVTAEWVEKRRELLAQIREKLH